jgi:hypothetical protein
MPSWHGKEKYYLFKSPKDLSVYENSNMCSMHPEDAEF